MLQQLHRHPRVRLLVTSRVQLGATLRPGMKLEPLGEYVAAALVLGAVCNTAAAKFCWGRSQAVQLAAECQHNALLLSIVTGLVAMQACTVQAS